MCAQTQQAGHHIIMEHIVKKVHFPVWMNLELKKPTVDVKVTSIFQ